MWSKGKSQGQFSNFNAPPGFGYTKNPSGLAQFQNQSDKKILSLEESLALLTQQTAKFQLSVEQSLQASNRIGQENSQAISELKTQVGLISDSLREKGKFPSQTQPNPRGVHELGAKPSNQLNVVRTLRSGRVVDNKVTMPDSEHTVVHPSGSHLSYQ